MDLGGWGSLLELSTGAGEETWAGGGVQSAAGRGAHLFSWASVLNEARWLGASSVSSLCASAFLADDEPQPIGPEPSRRQRCFSERRLDQRRHNLGPRPTNTRGTVLADLVPTRSSVPGCSKN